MIYIIRNASILLVWEMSGIVQKSKAYFGCCYTSSTGMSLGTNGTVHIGCRSARHMISLSCFVRAFIESFDTTHFYQFQPFEIQSH